jgi:hypothetical protein
LALLTNGGFGPHLSGGTTMFSSKFYFVGNLILGVFMLTFSLMSWFMTDFYNGIHLLMTISGSMSLSYSLSMYDKIYYANDLYDESDVVEG